MLDSYRLLFLIWQSVLVFVLYHLSFQSKTLSFFCQIAFPKLADDGSHIWRLRGLEKKRANLASFIFLRLHKISIGLQSIELKYYCWSTLLLFVKITKKNLARVSWNNYKITSMIFPVLKNYDRHGIQMHYHLVRKRTLNYFNKQSKTILMFYFAAASNYIICTKKVL